ncbi:ankyrin repeat domain-containing protein [Sulfurimonas sp. HSL1-2]|uniref:ankyrin repeat domain-containing protein n=1 Tax=Thiomicrolovo zhangzhouensis TaxID=3131933 RepID=UPI0031F795BF
MFKNISITTALTRIVAFLSDIFLVSLVIVLFLPLLPKSYVSLFPYALIGFSWLYRVFLPLSPLRGTLGKKLFGLTLERDNSEPLTFRTLAIRETIVLGYFLYVSAALKVSELTHGNPSILLFLGLSLLPVLLIFLDRDKRSLHDRIALTVVLDTIESSAPPLRIFRMFLRTVAILGLLIITGYYMLFASVMWRAAQQAQALYDQSYQRTYPTNDYGDARIRFYADALNVYVPRYIDAEDEYDIFANDIKSELAQNCIDRLQKLHDPESTGEGRSFYKNARNAYVANDKIDLAQEQEAYSSSRFYVVDTNLINEIERDITGLSARSLHSPCDDSVNVEILYDSFAKKYFESFEHQLFLEDEDEQWYETFKEHHPELILLQEQKALEAKLDDEERLIRKKEARKKMLARLRYDRSLKRGPSIFYVIANDQEKVLDELLRDRSILEVRNGNSFTPLFYAVRLRKEQSVKKLLLNGADMYADLHRMTPFDVAVTDGDRSIPIIKMFLEHGYDVNYQYLRGPTALTIAAKKCRNFALVELLLSNGADPALKDKFGGDTLTRIQASCKGKNLERMQELIAKYP